MEEITYCCEGNMNLRNVLETLLKHHGQNKDGDLTNEIWVIRELIENCPFCQK